MMVNGKSVIVESILLFAVSVGSFLFGVWAGLQRHWFFMGMGFSFAVWVFINVVYSVLTLSIDSCFKRLEELASKQSDSAPPRTQK
ncbi:MAG: hypothetical protein ACYTEK_10200 [Planctomycetota bacterium]|jgi:hypothetical protein